MCDGWPQPLVHFSCEGEGVDDQAVRRTKHRRVQQRRRKKGCCRIQQRRTTPRISHVAFVWLSRRAWRGRSRPPHVVACAICHFFEGLRGEESGYGAGMARARRPTKQTSRGCSQTHVIASSQRRSVTGRRKRRKVARAKRTLQNAANGQHDVSDRHRVCCRNTTGERNQKKTHREQQKRRCRNGDHACTCDALPNRGCRKAAILSDGIGFAWGRWSLTAWR
mmetsp:Transcript_22621/g.70131  ORF Transcript_22621/g.70131 Transcript_22621/m.70131 type:complete len:222 (-) Transcript_22621:296-961(-)